MKRFFSLLLAAVIMMSAFPQAAFAKAKQMNDGVPVWNEDSVRQYALDYVAAKSMDRLWGYYDLQIRRYMPMETYESLLIDLHWMTGDFVGLGSYTSFSESNNDMKTHILHLCMEKQDVDMYFTHKDREDDWEIMAIEFVPAAKQNVAEEQSTALLVDDTETNENYTEVPVKVGSAPYELEGILTLPSKASAQSPVPACVLIHEQGANDRDLTIGKTKMFRDLAVEFAKMDIATVRFDKRSFVYPDAVISTVAEETVEDALSVISLLKNDDRIAQNKIVVLGVGYGAMVTPRIASQSEGAVNGMILIGGLPETLAEVDFTRNKDSVAVLPKEEADAIKNVVRKITGIKEETARAVDMFGHNGYYYWEDAQYDAVNLIKKLRIPVLITQGKRDPLVDNDTEGVLAYKKKIGIYKALYTYETLRGLNHLLMDDLTTGKDGLPEYAVETHVDKYAAMTLAQWILALNNNN